MSTSDKIKKAQERFYSRNKSPCAGEVPKTVSLEELISKTLHTIFSSNKIYVNYLVFKTYANPLNYHHIINALIKLIISTIDTYGSFEIHINLQSFTISDARRYEKIYQLYYDTCCACGLQYKFETIDNIYIYYTPYIIDMISSLIVKFTDKDMKKKIILVGKSQSHQDLKTLLQESII